MTHHYPNKYLEMLKTDFGKKPLPQEPPELSKNINSVIFVSSRGQARFSFLTPLRCRWGPLRCLPELPPGGVLALP